ncbi:hypothetical protein HK102_000294 [Quaeritorhiza haematococci]|nr:hypothetical protein HK102_000294 [Quaeritorhiza haematococci]
MTPFLSITALIIAAATAAPISQPQTHIARRYELLPSTLNGRGHPIFKPNPTHQNLDRRGMIRTTTVPTTVPTASNSSFNILNDQNRVSFIVDFHCDVNLPSADDLRRNPSTLLEPYNNATHIRFACEYARKAMERACERLARIILLEQPVRINASFSSFCPRQQSQTGGGSSSSDSGVRGLSEHGQDGKVMAKEDSRSRLPPSLDQSQEEDPCQGRDGTLAVSSPSAWHVFSAESAEALGVDPNYLYPASLAKQYAPNDPVFANAQDPNLPGYYDISMNFNSDFAWWFATDEDPVGEPDTTDGPFGSQTLRTGTVPRPKTKGNVYDMEQIVVHEMLHGLGFISGWYTWTSDDMLLPSWVDSDSNGTITGLAQPYIFDRLLADTTNGVWMADYAKVIMRDAKDVATKLQTPNFGTFLDMFNDTEGANIARTLRNTTAVTPRKVASWFPLGPWDQLRSQAVGTQVLFSNAGGLNYGMDYGLLYTAKEWMPGSTFSHLDADCYDGTTEFLMRPYGTPGFGLDATSSGPTGPIGRLVLGILRGMGYATALGPL